MAPIPLRLVGILLAPAMMGAFFTATSMIGFIAGASINVRKLAIRRRSKMPEWVWPVFALLAYLILTRWLLPKLGIPT